MNTTEIYGFENYSFYVSNPRGEVSWFSSRVARDAAKSALITEARAEGLDVSVDPFPRVRMELDTYEKLAWFDILVTHEMGDPCDCCTCDNRPEPMDECEKCECACDDRETMTNYWTDLAAEDAE